MREVRRPRCGDTRLEVVLVPVIHGFAPIRRAGLLGAHRGCVVVALEGSSFALIEVVSQRVRRAISTRIKQAWKDFEPIGLVDWPFEAVAKTGCQSEMRLNLPGILKIAFVGLC